MNFKLFLENTDLYQGLNSIRPQIAMAAQQIYDQWNQVDGIDDEFGGGGICDAISNEISNIISTKLPNTEVTYGGQDGDDHAWTVAYDQEKAYGVDIPHHYYETGGGYNWTKIPNVRFAPNHVEIWEMQRNWIEPH